MQLLTLKMQFHLIKPLLTKPLFLQNPKQHKPVSSNHHGHFLPYFDSPDDHFLLTPNFLTKPFSSTTPNCLYLHSKAASTDPLCPFVQGMAQFPVQSCCDNLKQLSIDQPACLCLLFTNSSLGSVFPINTTLAPQLPSLCGTRVDASVCSSPGVPEVPPSSQISPGGLTNSSLGRNSNSSVAAASPMIQVAPRPVVMGLGLSRGSSVRMKAEGSLALLLLSLLFI